MIERKALLDRIRIALGRSRIVALTGPRQCGKTTLARQLLPVDSPNYFDLEDPTSLARLDEPMTALQHLKGLIVIDEVHRRPDIFPVLRVLADRTPLPARFLILGSTSPNLIKQSSESLAGRVETVSMSGLTLPEAGVKAISQHWLRGGYPLSFLADNDVDSFVWRKNFIQTLLERDVPQFGIRIPAVTLLRFWTMLAHYHGNIWNASEPARSLGIGESTARRYVDLMTDIFMVHQLPAWHSNLKKRQVKSPKLYLNDTGILHQLLGIRSEKDLLSHPKCGFSWEGYVIGEILRVSEPDESYFWATHGGAEIDLIIIKNGRMLGIECKRVDAPRLTPSIRIAIEELKLERVVIVYPGTRCYQIADRVTAVPIGVLLQSPADFL